MPDRHPPDRYRDAVLARRAELADARALLTGTHRAELRSELALSRIAASDAVGAALAQLGREARGHVGHADRQVRRRLPGRLTAAVDEVAAAVHRSWTGELAPGLRRIAAVRSLDVGSGWPRLPSPRVPLLPLPPVLERARSTRSLLGGAAEGLALWRLVLLPLAVLPLLGLPALGGSALLPLAAGVGVAGAAAAVRSRRVALERAALRQVSGEILGAARSALEADLGRRLVEVERSVGGELDSAVGRRRRAVDAELRALSPAVADA